jgi:hypothetical protein
VGGVEGMGGGRGEALLVSEDRRHLFVTPEGVGRREGMEDGEGEEAGV